MMRTTMGMTDSHVDTYDGVDSFLCSLDYRYDHERDDDYEQMQKAETCLLRHYPQFLPRAFAPATPATATDVA